MCKGRIWADLGDIWRVVLEILPLQNSMEKPKNTNKKTTKTIERPRKPNFPVVLYSFFILTPAEFEIQTRQILHAEHKSQRSWQIIIMLASEVLPEDKKDNTNLRLSKAFESF